MNRLPVLGDLDATRQPDPVVGLHVVTESFERRGSSRTADQSAVQANG